MKKIVVKEIDRFKSSIREDKYLSEYLIYLIFKQDDNDIILEAYTELDEENKNTKVNEILLEHNNSFIGIDKKDIIEIITFEEYIKEI